MAEIERVYTIPLRISAHVPRTKRARHAVTQIKDFIIAHMKAEKENIWIDPQLTQLIWARGIQNPPTKVRVRVIKFEDNLVEVSLPEV